MVTAGVTLEDRFVRDSGGRIRAVRHYSYEFLSNRFLGVFDHLVVHARVDTNVVADPRSPAVDGPGVTFREMRGSLSALTGRAELPAVDVWILRVPGVAGQARWHSALRRATVGVEVVGDPLTSIPAALGGVRGRVFGRALSLDLRRLTRRADGVAYVSREALEGRYPHRPNALVAEYSSVELTGDWFRDHDDGRSARRPVHLITVCSMERPYKGVDTLIRAQAALRDQGIAVVSRVVGGGKMLGHYRAMAKEYGLDDSAIRFSGEVPRAELKHLLDESNIFVLASRTEGLPRALLEAMARGLPCLATPVGGIGTVLSHEYTFPVDDEANLARLVTWLAHDRDASIKAGQHNLQVARSFSSGLLEARRTSFYTGLAERATDSPN